MTSALIYAPSGTAAISWHEAFVCAVQGPDTWACSGNEVIRRAAQPAAGTKSLEEFGTTFMHDKVSVGEPGPALHNLVQVSVGQPAPVLDNLAHELHSLYLFLSPQLLCAFVCVPRLRRPLVLKMQLLSLAYITR